MNADVVQMMIPKRQSKYVSKEWNSLQETYPCDTNALPESLGPSGSKPMVKHQSQLYMPISHLFVQRFRRVHAVIQFIANIRARSLIAGFLNCNCDKCSNNLPCNLWSHTSSSEMAQSRMGINRINLAKGSLFRRTASPQRSKPSIMPWKYQRI